MPVSVYHAHTATAPDITNSGFDVLPQRDWNNSHAITLSLSGTDIVGAFSNTPQVSFGTNSAGYVTATVTTAQSTQPVAVSDSNGSFQFSTLSLGAANGLTLYATNSSVVGSYTTPPTSQFLQSSVSTLFEQTSATSAITSNAVNTSVSTQFAGTATSFGGTNVSGSVTLNSAGLSLSLSGPATTQFMQTSVSSLFEQTSATSAITSNALASSVSTKFAGTGTTFSGTNVSASVTLNSAGLDLALSAGAGGGFSGGVSTLGNTAGNTGTQTGQIVFAGINNITLSVSTVAGGAQTVSISGATVAAQPLEVSAGTSSGALGTLVLSNSNNVSFGLSGSTVTATASFAQSVQTQASGNIGGTGFATTTTNGSVIVGTNNTAGITLAVPPYLTTTAAQSTQPVAVSGSNGSFAFSTLTMGNLNGLTFYTSAGSLVGSYTVPTVTQYFSNTGTTFAGANISGSLTLNTAGLDVSLSVAAPGGGAAIEVTGANGSSVNASTLAFSNSNGMSLGVSTGVNGATVTGSYTQSAQAVSASGGSSTFSTLVFANSNGITFTNTNGSIAASYNSTQFAGTGTTFSGTNVSGSITLNSAGIDLALSAAGGVTTGGGYIAGNTTGQSSSSTYPLSSLNVSAAGIISAGWSSNTLVVSGPGTTGLSQMSLGISGGNTSGNTGTVAQGQVVLAGGNNVTLSGSTAGSNMTITISAANAGGAQTGISSIAGSGGTQTVGMVSFAASNGITFGMSTGVNSGTMTASYTVPTQSNQTDGIYASSQTFGQSSSSTHDARSLTIVGSGALAVGWSNSSLVLSASSQSVQTQASGNIAGTGFATTTTNGSVIVGTQNTAGETLAVPPFITTYAAQTVQPVAASGSNGSFAFSTLTHGNLNGISFYTSASSIVASYNSTQFAGTGTTFAGANVSGSMTLNSAGLNLSLSAATGGGGGNTGITGYISNNSTNGSSGTVALSALTFEADGGVSMGFSNSKIQVSAPAVSALTGVNGILVSSAGSTISVSQIQVSKFYYPPEYVALNTSGIGQNSISIQRFAIDSPMSGSDARLILSASANTDTSASTNTYAFTVSAGIYTLNGSTLSLASSGSQGYSGTWSTNSTASINGVRELTVPLNVALTQGEYWFAAGMSTASTNNSVGFSVYQQSAQNTAYEAIMSFGAATAASRLLYPYEGIYSATSASLPASVNIADVNGTGTFGSRANIAFILENYTVQA